MNPAEMNKRRGSAARAPKREETTLQRKEETVAWQTQMLEENPGALRDLDLRGTIGALKRIALDSIMVQNMHEIDSPLKRIGWSFGIQKLELIGRTSPKNAPTTIAALGGLLTRGMPSDITRGILFSIGKVGETSKDTALAAISKLRESYANCDVDKKDMVIDVMGDVGKVSPEAADMVLDIIGNISEKERLRIRNAVIWALSKIGPVCTEKSKAIRTIEEFRKVPLQGPPGFDTIRLISCIGRMDIESADAAVAAFERIARPGCEERFSILYELKTLGGICRDKVKVIEISKMYLNDHDPMTRSRAAGNIVYICATHPAVMLREFGIQAEKKDINRCANLAAALLIAGKEINGKTHDELKRAAKEEMEKAIGCGIDEKFDFDPYLFSDFKFLENENVRTLLRTSFEGRFNEHVMSFKQNVELKERMQRTGVNTGLWETGGEMIKKSKPLTITAEGAVISSDSLEDANKRLYSLMLNALEGQKKRAVYGKLTKFPEFLKALDEFKGRKRRGDIPLKLEREKIDSIIRFVVRGGKNRELSKIFSADDVRQIEESILSPAEKKGGRTYRIAFGWSDKNPRYAFCEGNHSGCCIAFNGEKNWTLPLYLKDYGTRIMQIKDVSETGKEMNIGQAWLMTGFDKQGAPVLIVDSVELSSGYRMKAIENYAFFFLSELARNIGFRKMATITKHSGNMQLAVEEDIENTIYRWGEKVYSDFGTSAPLTKGGWVVDLSDREPVHRVFMGYPKS